MLTALQLSIGYWSAVGFCVGALLIGGIYLFKRNQQHVADHMRVTSLVSLPRDVTHDEVLAFVRSLSGLAKPKVFQPIYAVSLETYADIRGIKHYLSIPGHVVEGVEGWLETHIPGSSITRITDAEDLVANTEWERGAEFTLTSNKPLLIKDPKHIAATILSGLTTLNADSAVVLQWIVFRAEPQNPHDERNHKDKVSDATFRAAARVAARGEDAYRLVRDVYAGLSVTHAYGVKFIPHLSKKVPERVNKRKGLWDYRIFLNASELSVVMGWPFNEMNVPGLGGARARRLAPDYSIPESGIKLATSNYPKTRGRSIALPFASTIQHQWIIGPTGTGKSALLHNEAAQAINEGLGVVVIEPKGDLARDVLNSVPERRAGDVIWFDATDNSNPIGFNILAGPDPERVSAHIVSLFKNLYHDSWGPRLEYILKYAILTAALSDLTLYDVKQLLISPEFRVKIVRNLKHPEAKSFWKRREDKSDSDLDSVINKLDAFAGTTTMRRIIGQRSGLDMAEVVNNKKILLVPLDSIAIGEANAAMLGSMLVDQLWTHARLRPRENRSPIVVILDEFQNFLHLNVSIEDAFAMARSYQLGFIVAHQHTGQLPPSVLNEVKANARTKISFGLGPDDAGKISQYFSPMTASDLGSLSQYEVAMSIHTETGTSPVATGKTYPPPLATGYGNAALRASQKAYGRPASEVEAELRERHKAAEKTRPKFGERDS